MEWNKIGRWTSLVVSVSLGVVAGWGGLLIFEAKVPDATQTAMLAAEVRVYYLVSGAAFGLVIFGWTDVVARIASARAASSARRVGVLEGESAAR